MLRGPDAHTWRCPDSPDIELVHRYRVRLEVTNDCTPTERSTPGHGLINMRERARLEGGELEAGPVDGGFRVRAMLPFKAAVP